MAARRALTAGASSAGARVSSRMCSDSSISPTPIATRPRSRVRVRPPRRKAMRPPRKSAGATAATLNDRTWTISVVPTLAPSMMARAETRSTEPPLASDAVISPVAVLLCSTAVASAPAPKARKRFRSAVPRKRRRWGPKARTMPLWTMWRPHSSSATPPIRSSRIMLPPSSSARRSAAVAGRAALDCFEALPGDDGQHAERGQRIGPPPAERAVEEQAAEEDGGEVAAERGLPRIGGEGAAAHPRRDAALGAGEERHGHERENRQRDAGKALRRPFPEQEGAAGLVGHVGGEGEEACSDDAQARALDSRSPRRVEVGGETPEGGHAGGELDQAVNSEAKQRHAPGRQAGRERHDGLEAVE